MGKGPRKYSSDVSISFGLVTLTGSLYPLASKEKEGSFKTACPTCGAEGIASRMSQGYTCTTDSTHGPFAVGECFKCKEVGDKLVLVSAEEVEQVRGTEDETASLLRLRVHPAAQVNRKAWPTGNSYWFEPNKGSEQSYGLMADLAGEPDFAFTGTMILRKQEKFFRIIRAEFGIVLEELYRPEQVHDFEMPTTNYNGELISMALELVEKQMTDFDPSDYRSTVGDRMAEMLAAKDGTGTIDPGVPAKSKATPADDLAALLQASITASEEAKAS
jgi:non-homologous end joining protein Ku